ncbi:MAG: shikimate kinase, partial [bacterium]
LERKEMEAALASEPAIIAPGGGWAAQPGALDAAKGAAYVIYLKTRADTAAARAAPSGTRPVLMGDDPEARMKALLSEREAFYMRAHANVETDRKTANQVAADVIRLAQTNAGW